MDSLETHTKNDFLPLLTVEDKKLMGLDSEAFNARMQKRYERVLLLKSETNNPNQEKKTSSRRKERILS